MNIGIDGYEANIINRVGIGQYAFQLLKAIYNLDNTNHYFIFLPNKPLADMPEIREGWEYVVGKPGSFWTIFQLPKLIKQKTLHLFFSPTHYTPWISGIGQIMSIMDLAYIHYPKMFRIKDLIQLKAMTAVSIKKSQKILTISEFSKNEIIDHYHLKNENVIVTYPGLSPDLKLTDGLSFSQLQTKFKISKDYILFVSTIQPRKNLTRLIEAFEKIDFAGILVLVGKKGWLYESIFKRIKTSPKHDQIMYLDFVDTKDLAGLYKHAVCLAMPSLYEGFGIPVVEAMYFGCPVVVSRTTSLPEIARDAGIYVDPASVDDIAEGLVKAVQLSQAEREKLIIIGKKRTESFSWDKCARQTLEVFASIKI